jgi:hypothetical protein
VDSCTNEVPRVLKSPREFRVSQGESVSALPGTPIQKIEDTGSDFGTKIKHRNSFYLALYHRENQESEIVRDFHAIRDQYLQGKSGKLDHP